MMITPDPFRDQRLLIAEQERKHRDEQGIYQSSNWMVRAGIAFLVSLIFIWLVLVVLHLF